MSYCVNINSTEHLPQENTLLINYTITCSGLWDLLQLDTAYRNVCDDYWTVMYANIQHPRHTDFPISVGVNPVNATYAWNYGGIQGIGPENFDPNHSYLVQLGIFNSSCSGISQTGSNSGSNPIGQQLNLTSGNTVVLAPFTPSRPGPRRPPLTPATPTPGTGIIIISSVPITTTNNSPTQPIGSVFPQNPIGTNYVISGLDPGNTTTNPPISTNAGYIPPLTNPTIPINYENNTNGPIIVNGAGQTSPINIYNENNGVVINSNSSTIPIVFGTIGLGNNGSTIPIGANQNSIVINGNNTVSTTNVNSIVLGGNSTNIHPSINTLQTSFPTNPIVTNVSNQLYLQGTTIGNTVTSPNQGGGTIIPSNPKINFSQASIPSISTQEDQESQGIDVGLNRVSNINAIDGNLSALNYDLIAIESSDQTLRYFDLKSIHPAGKSIIKISSDDLVQGEKLFISSVFKLPLDIDLIGHIELWLLDSQGRKVLLRNTSNGILNKATISISLNTYQTPPGSNTLLLLAKDSSNRVVGISSKKFVIRPVISVASSNQRNLLKESSNRIHSDDVPAILSDYLGLSKNYEEFVLKDSKQVSFILQRTAQSNNLFSALVVAADKNSDFTITVRAKSGYVHSGEIKNSQIFDASIIGFSENRVILDGSELFPAAHNAGIANIPTTETYLIISIAQRNGEIKENTKIRLYLSNSYVLKPITATEFVARVPSDVVVKPTYTHTIIISTPYPNTKLGLINHGMRKGYIPENYTIINANTNKDGDFTWSSNNLEYGNYFSVIVAVNGIINPYKGIVFTSKI